MGLNSELAALLFENILQQVLELLIGDSFAFVVVEEVRASDSFDGSAQFFCSDLPIFVVI